MSELGDMRPLVDASYGSFTLDSLILHRDHDAKPISDPAEITALRESGAPMSDLAQHALKHTTGLHELRHLHDSFGTMAGISLFAAWKSTLSDFVTACRIVHESGQRWPLPVASDGYEELPVPARRFVDHVLNVRGVRDRFRGSRIDAAFSDRADVPSPLPHVSRVREELLGTVVYAFPAQVRHLKDGQEENSILHVPLTFDTILEGNANTIQRNAIADLWGADVADFVFNLRRFYSVDEGRVKTTLYNVTDLMVTRYLQTRGHPSFQRNSILALSDLALQEQLVLRHKPDGTREVGLACPGHAFHQHMVDLDPESIVAGDIETASDEAYAALIDQYDTLPDWDEASTTATFQAAIATVVTWVSKEIIVPLLEARLRTGHRVFTSYEQWMLHVPELPGAPFEMNHAGKLRSNVPKDVYQAWLTVRFLESMLLQLANGEPALLCPRAYRLVPGFEDVEFAFEGSCDSFVEDQVCGRVQPGLPLSSLPDCAFSSTAGLLGFGAE